MEALAAAAAAAADELADAGARVVLAHDALLADTTRALDMVRAFVVERGLVVYGGLAVDFALRAAGRPGIYGPDVLPDYDFYSTDPVGDADDLAARFVRAGFSEVRAVRGIHAVTSRVRAGGVWVADITYCPVDVFARLPVVVYRGVRVRAPVNQAIDQHLALSRPLNGAPTEDVFHRFAKDLARFNRLADAYALAGTEAAAAAPSEAVRRHAELPAAVTAGEWAVHGYAALGLYRGALARLLAATGAAADATKADAGAGATVVGRVVTADVPAAAAAAIDVVFAGDPAALGSGVRRAPLMDWRPATWEPAGGGLRVHLVRGTRVAAAVIAGAPVVSPQYLAVMLLTDAFAADGAARAAHLAHYGALLGVLDAADAAIARAGGAGRALPAAIAALARPFALFTGTVVGRETDSAALQVNQSARLEALGEPPLFDATQLPPGKLGQFGWGGKLGLPRLVFDYAASPAFWLDGRELEASESSEPSAPDASATDASATDASATDASATVVLPVSPPGPVSRALATAACRAATAAAPPADAVGAGLWYLVQGMRGRAPADETEAFASAFEERAAVAFTAAGAEFENEAQLKAAQIAETGRARATPDFLFRRPVAVAGVGPALTWADAKSYPLALAFACSRNQFDAQARARILDGLVRQRRKYEREFGAGFFFGPAAGEHPFAVIDEAALARPV